MPPQLQQEKCEIFAKYLAVSSKNEEGIRVGGGGGGGGGGDGSGGCMKDVWW